MHHFNYKKYISTLFLLLFGLSMSAYADDVDLISDFRAQDKIGTTEVPHLFATVQVKKQRDLHIVVRDMESWKIVKNVTKRVKKSGKYNLKVPVKNLKANNRYRVEAYLTPRKKKWADRIDEPVNHVINVIDAPVYVQKAKFSDKDRVRQVSWPKVISDNDEKILKVMFDITEKRELHIKLYNTANWSEELGVLKSTEKKPGSRKYPISDIVKNFPDGKYAWVVYLTEVGGEESLTEKKAGKHFEIKKAE